MAKIAKVTMDILLFRVIAKEHLSSIILTWVSKGMKAKESPCYKIQEYGVG